LQIMLILLLAAVVGGLVWKLTQPREPSFQGKHTSASNLTLLVLILACVTLVGCSSPEVHRGNDPVYVAKLKAESWGWKKVSIENVQFEGGRWLVTVWKLPKTPGDNATIEISEDGRVLAATGFR
jgi:hypothetical protein